MKNLRMFNYLEIAIIYLYSRPRSESPSVIPPPPDVKPIIDKLAEYVARNGQAFEQSIRTKSDPRFGFLERDHIHHNYYQLKVQLCTVRKIEKKFKKKYCLFSSSSKIFCKIKQKKIQVFMVKVLN